MLEKRFYIYNLSRPFFQLLAGFFLYGLSHLGLAFIVQFFAFRDADLKLYPPVLPVDASNDERHAFLRGFAGQFFDLASMEQKLSRPQRVVIVDIAVGVMRDMRIQQPNFAFEIGRASCRERV